jgi:hypothetical protein
MEPQQRRPRPDLGCSTSGWMDGHRSRSQWPCSLRRRYAAAWLLGSQVRIPLEAWMFVSCVYMLCCPVWVEVSATGWSLVQRSPTICLIVCVITETPKGALCSKLGAYRKMNEWAEKWLPTWSSPCTLCNCTLIHLITCPQQQVKQSHNIPIEAQGGRGCIAPTHSQPWH